MAKSHPTDILTDAHRLRPLLLRFAGKDVERDFQKHSLTRGLPTIRAFLIAGTFLYAVFGILDILAVPENATELLLIRFGFIVPMLTAVCALTFLKAFQKLAQPALVAAMFSAGLGIIAMTMVIEGPMRENYYAGLIMVVIYCTSLIRLHWTYATLSTILLVGLYQPVALVWNPISPGAFVSNNFFLCMSGAVGIFSSYVMELFIRLEYRNAQVLHAEKERSIVLMEEAQAADRAKSEFLSVVSHELRTPLNAIIGFSELIRNQTFGPLGAPAYVEYVNDIHESGQHLLRIISDVLDLSKAEMGKLRLTEEEVDLTELLTRCCRMMRTKAAEGGLRLSLKSDAANTCLLGDSALLKQLFLNLLSNAIKFTPSGGSVTVDFTRRSDGGITVTVADTGIGIGKDDLKRVMEPFSQVETAYSRQHSGTGLGLALAKRITDLHKADLKLDSTLGAGTTVSVNFPSDRTFSRQNEEIGSSVA